MHIFEEIKLCVFVRHKCFREISVINTLLFFLKMYIFFGKRIIELLLEYYTLYACGGK